MTIASISAQVKAKNQYTCHHCKRTALGTAHSFTAQAASVEGLAVVLRLHPVSPYYMPVGWGYHGYGYKCAACGSNPTRLTPNGPSYSA